MQKLVLLDYYYYYFNIGLLLFVLLYMLPLKRFVWCVVKALLTYLLTHLFTRVSACSLCLEARLSGRLVDENEIPIANTLFSGCHVSLSPIRRPLAPSFTAAFCIIFNHLCNVFIRW